MSLQKQIHKRLLTCWHFHVKAPIIFLVRCMQETQTYFHFHVKGRHQQKKTFSFGHCLNYLPPHPPIRATWSLIPADKNNVNDDKNY